MDRISKLQRQITTDALIVDDPTDLYYLTGLALSVGRMALYPDRAVLFVDGRYIEKAKKEGPCEARLRDTLPEYLESARRIGFDSAYVTCDGLAALEKNLPGKEWIPLSKPLKQLRAVKERKEIEALKKAARLTWEGYQRLLTLLKEGIAEEELAMEFEFFCRSRGAEKLSFSPIIAFGENSAYPHYRAGRAKLKKGENIQFDLGVYVDGYAGDMSRVHFFGPPDPQIEKDYRLIQRVQQRAVAAIRPGLRFGELNQLVKSALKEEGVAHLFNHGLSHGVGLDLHEYPTLRADGGDSEVILAPGMVITVEPGMYRPGLGGVRYEDTVLVTETGVDNFYPQSAAKIC